MRIGIDCRTILHPGYGEGAGVGHYTYFLVKNLLEIDKENQYVLFFDTLLREEAIFEFIHGAVNVTTIEFPFHKYKKLLPYNYAHMLVSAALQSEQLDIYHNPANFIPLHYHGNCVMTIHDLAIYKYPQWFPKNIISRTFSTKYLVPNSVKKAKKIIAISQHTKQDIIDLFDTPSEKIDVIYNGVHVQELIQKEKAITFEEVKKQFGIHDNFILFVGTMEPRKNLIHALKAFEKYRENVSEQYGANTPAYQFVLCGAKGWKYDDIMKEINHVNKRFKNAVAYIGYVDHPTKLTLMKYAKTFLFPSFYEGFGLPVLEAMALRTPVITSKTTSLQEIAAQGAILIDPYDIEDMYRALKKILIDMSPSQYEDMRKHAKENSEQFSWENCARQTLHTYTQMK